MAMTIYVILSLKRFR